MASSGEILVAFLLLGFVIWRYIKQKTSFHKLLVHLPGPEKNLIFGNMLEFKSSTVFLPKLCEYRDKYGDIFKLWVGPTFLSIIISDYKLLEALLCSNKNLYKSWQYKYLNNWLGQGLLTSEPIRWKKHRKLFTPAFHFQILEKFVEMFEKPTTTLIKILEKKIDLNSVDIYHLINLWSLDIMCETSMGTTLNAQENSECEYVHAVKEMGKIIMNRSFSPAKHYDFFYIFSKDYYKEKAALKILHGFTNSMIQQRRSELKKLNDSTENEKADYYRQRKMTFLEVLLLSHIAGKPLSDKSIREEVDTFLFEGHDTITSAVSFALYCLATHKDVQDKVVEEQTEIFGADKNPTVQMGDLYNMKYLDLVIKESLRLYPPVPLFARELVEDMVVDGQIYPSGLNCIINAYGLHRNPKYFENPDDFIPTRFAEIKSELPFAFIPFSAGQRNCIGQKFAMLEAKYVISAVIRNFELSPPTSDEKLVLVAETILKGLNGIKISIKERSR